MNDPEETDAVLAGFMETWSAFRHENINTKALDTDIARRGWPKPTIYREHETIHVLLNLIDHLRRELDEAERERDEWRETAVKFSHDYHAELDRRIAAEAEVQRYREDIEALADRLEPHARNMQQLGEIEISVPPKAPEEIAEALERRGRWSSAAAQRVWENSGYTDERHMAWFAIRSGAFQTAAQVARRIGQQARPLTDEELTDLPRSGTLNEVEDAIATQLGQ